MEALAAQITADKSNSEVAAAAALVSEKNAKTSETNAKVSETASKNSETNAKVSETASKTSETNAKTSEENSKTSETNAKVYMEACSNGAGYTKVEMDALLKKKGGVSIGTITGRLSKKPEAGELAVDTGALVSRATYPDLWAWVQANAPLLSETDWQAQAAAQTSVGAYSTGDGSTTFRLPRLLDYMRGGLTADVGKWQSDAMQGHYHKTYQQTGGPGDSYVSGANTNGSSGYTYTATAKELISDSTNGTPRIADENRPKTIKVLYCVKAFDAEVNPGLVDITALANEVAGLSADVNNSFTVIYPNNGTAATPATVSINSRYVCTNPFPGHYVQCKAEIKYNGKWCETGWTTTTSSGFSDGVKATQLLPDDNIIVQSGVNQFALGSAYSGNGFGTGTTILGNSPVPCRVLVWKGGKF